MSFGGGPRPTRMTVSSIAGSGFVFMAMPPQLTNSRTSGIGLFLSYAVGSLTVYWRVYIQGPHFESLQSRGLVPFVSISAMTATPVACPGFWPHPMVGATSRIFGEPPSAPDVSSWLPEESAAPSGRRASAVSLASAASRPPSETVMAPFPPAAPAAPDSVPAAPDCPAPPASWPPEPAPAGRATPDLLPHAANTPPRRST